MKRRVIIAHDNKKVDLVAWATFNRETLSRFSLTATRHTARLLERKIGLPVEELLSGPEGGDTQIAARVAVRAIDAVFFFVVATADLIITAFGLLDELPVAPELAL